MSPLRHTGGEFLAFLAQLVATQPRRRAVHLIADNVSAHKTEAVVAWFAGQARVTLHHPPSYSSWRDQVELCFAQNERQCIACGLFTSTADLRHKLTAHIQAHSKICRPFRWACTDPSHGIQAIERRETPLG